MSYTVHTESGMGRKGQQNHSLLQLIVKLEGKQMGRADNQNQMDMNHLSNWVKG